MELYAHFTVETLLSLDICADDLREFTSMYSAHWQEFAFIKTNDHVKVDFSVQATLHVTTRYVDLNLQGLSQHRIPHVANIMLGGWKHAGS